MILEAKRKTNKKTITEKNIIAKSNLYEKREYLDIFEKNPILFNLIII